MKIYIKLTMDDISPSINDFFIASIIQKNVIYEKMLHMKHCYINNISTYVTLLHIHQKNQAQTPKEPHQKHSEEPPVFTPPNLQNHVHIISALSP